MSPNTTALAVPKRRPRGAGAGRAPRAALHPVPPFDLAGIAAAPVCTLEALCARLGPELLELAVAPEGLDAPVAGIAIADLAHPLHVEPRAVVLGVGIDEARDGEACQLVERAAAAGAAAVVLRRRIASSERFLALAHERVVALLLVPADSDWDELYGLMRAVVRAQASEPAEWGARGAVLTDLFALADAVAAATGAFVGIEDQQLRVLAYSQDSEAVDPRWAATILARRTSPATVEALQRDGVLERLRTSDEVVHVPGAAGLRPRRGLAIRSEHTLLGAIWLAEGNEPLDASADDALRHAARLAAPQLLRSRVVENLERTFRGNLLRELLFERAPASAAAAELGLPTDGTFMVVAYEVDAPHTALGPLVRGRLVDLLTMHFHSFRREASVVATPERVYCLVASRPGERPGSCARIVAESLAIAEASLHLALRAGTGATVTAIDEVPTSRHGADQAVDVGRARGERAVDINDVRAESFVLEFAEFAATRPAQISRQLGTLRDHDRLHATDYVETLTAYLACFGDSVLAAARLHVHPNTLRYRLKRLAKLASIDLQSSDQRFALELELRLLRHEASTSARPVA